MALASSRRLCVGRLLLMGCALGCWEGAGRRLQQGAASSSEPLLPSTFPCPLGLLKCATCRSLKGLFLCLDHKIAKEQWLSFKTAAGELFPTSHCHCHCCSTSKHHGAPGDERGESGGESGTGPPASWGHGEPACRLRPSLTKRVSPH